MNHPFLSTVSTSTHVRDVATNQFKSYMSQEWSDTTIPYTNQFQNYTNEEWSDTTVTYINITTKEGVTVQSKYTSREEIVTEFNKNDKNTSSGELNDYIENITGWFACLKHE